MVAGDPPRRGRPRPAGASSTVAVSTFVDGGVDSPSARTLGHSRRGLVARSPAPIRCRSVSRIEGDGTIEPVFLLSLPRSGSTLLQRLLGSHPAIATGPEPTFLLPLLKLRDQSASVSTYDQRYTALAIEDFFGSLGDGSFDETVRDWAHVAFHRAAPPGATYFLDKTPKYHQIAEDLARVFPDAPIIVLWRNPLAVISSMLETWGGGRWILHHFRLDLFDGLPRLIELVNAAAPNVITVRYEDLVADPSAQVDRLFRHLGLGPDPSVVSEFAKLELPGRIQDSNVSSEGFSVVRDDRTDRWEQLLGNPLRQRWCRRYLRWLGAERLATMGYQLDALLDQLDRLRTTRDHLGRDLVLMPYDTAYRHLQLGVVKRRLADGLFPDGPVLAYK